jgi:hypothetical protein
MNNFVMLTLKEERNFRTNREDENSYEEFNASVVQARLDFEKAVEEKASQFKASWRSEIQWDKWVTSTNY